MNLTGENATPLPSRGLMMASTFTSRRLRDLLLDDPDAFRDETEDVPDRPDEDFDDDFVEEIN